MTDPCYDATHFAALSAVEDHHFWFVHRNHVIAALLRAAAPPTARRLLEIGCGTGNVLRVLERAMPAALVVGLDAFAEGLDLARARSRGRLVRARVEALPFVERFDVIGMFDVLEHVPQDTDALAAIRERLLPDGRLLLTVPAHAWLWSEFDVAAGHVRRYSRAQLRERLWSGGFRPVRLTYFMAPLVPLLWAARRLRRGGDVVRRELEVSATANAALLAVLGLERRWIDGGRDLSMGTSLACVAVPR